jgi:ATP-binding protein involved in chromosome partitioning
LTMAVTRDDILKALSKVKEPELGKDLVTLNMVKDAAVEGSRVKVTVELTTPACPLKEKILREAEAALRAIPGVREAVVELTHRVAAQKTVPDRQSIPGVKNIVAVYACKGGVGKSTIAVNLAASLALEGCAVGLFDADIHGPDIPLMTGASGPPDTRGEKFVPVIAHGIKLMSMGFLSNENTPMIWRGPLVHGALKQLLMDTLWGELDYLVLDLPPGTGDAPLSLIQLVPLAGVVIVTTPQQAALLDGIKGIAMFKKLNVPILGLVENMSGFVCPHCHQETAIFKKGTGEAEAKKHGIPLIARIPLDPALTDAGDAGIPLVVGLKSSPQARALRWMSQVVAGQISIHNKE